jgi:hypothetical protein
MKNVFRMGILLCFLFLPMLYAGVQTSTTQIGNKVVTGGKVAEDTLPESSLDPAIRAKLHTHTNKAILDEYALTETDLETAGVNIVFSGTTTVDTGINADIIIPYDCDVTSVTLLADQSGSIVIDVWKDTYANFPPTVEDSITASAKPTISSATKSTDSTLSGWTTSLSQGDILRFNVDSVTSIERVLLFIKLERN